MSIKEYKFSVKHFYVEYRISANDQALRIVERTQRFFFLHHLTPKIYKKHQVVKIIEFAGKI